jgi:predicted acyl esterase
VAGGNDAYNRQFWQQRSTANVAADVVRNGIPALLWSGWEAQDLTASLHEYTIFQNAYGHQPVFGPMDTSRPASGRYQMIIGPWVHRQGLDKGIELEWYDTWLKSEQTGIKDTATPLHLFEEGSNRWINASSVPMVARYTPYYLNGGGALTTARPTSNAGSDAITWAQPTTAGSTLSYTTGPMPRGATLAGPIAASIYASSSNSNLELIADLYDVAPNGTSTRLSTGAILGSLNRLDQDRSWYDTTGLLVHPDHPFVADQPVPPGRVQRYELWLYPRLFALAPGHALRLTLSTQEPTTNCNGSPEPLSTLPQPCLLTAPQVRSLPGRDLPDRSQPPPGVVGEPSAPALPGVPYGVERDHPDQCRPGRAALLGPAGTPALTGVVRPRDGGASACPACTRLSPSPPAPSPCCAETPDAQASLHRGAATAQP